MSVQVKEPQKLNLYMCFKNRNFRQLFIKNKPNANAEDSPVVYKHAGSQERCQPIQTFLLFTTTTVKQRMTAHAKMEDLLISIFRNTA